MIPGPCTLLAIGVLRLANDGLTLLEDAPIVSEALVSFIGIPGVTVPSGDTSCEAARIRPRESTHPVTGEPRLFVRGRCSGVTTWQSTHALDTLPSKWWTGTKPGTADAESQTVATDGPDQAGEKRQLAPTAASPRDRVFDARDRIGWVVDSGAPEHLTFAVRFRWCRRGRHHCSDPRTAAGTLLPCRDERSRLVHQLGQLPLR